MSSTNDNGKSKLHRFPTPLFIKSNSPMTITDGKFSTSHTGIIVFHGDFVEFELQETPQKTLPETGHTERRGQADLSPIFSGVTVPDGHRLFTVSEAKSLAWDRKRSRYETYKRDKDLSYITIIRRNGHTNPPIRLGSLLDPESMISTALRYFSTKSPFLRSDLKTRDMPAFIGQGQRIKASLDVLEKEGYLTKSTDRVGPKRTIDKYVRTDKKLE